MNGSRKEEFEDVTLFLSGAFGVKAIYCRNLRVTEALEGCGQAQRLFMLEYKKPRMRKWRGVIGAEPADVWVVRQNASDLCPPVFEADPDDPMIKRTRHASYSPEWKKEFEANVSLVLASGLMSEDEFVIKKGVWASSEEKVK